MAEARANTQKSTIQKERKT